VLALAAALIVGVAVTPAATQEHPHFLADRAWTDLVKQVAFGPRVPGTEAQIKCRDWLIENLKKSCDTVETQPFSHVWSKSGQNLHMWNILGYQNWAKAKTRVVLIAHWDSRAEADQEKDPVRAAQPIPAANDGASAVAILTELARVMKGANPDIGVLYMLTDGEDLGPGEDEMYLGAIEFGRHLPQPAANYGILLDMLGKKHLRVPMEPNSVKIDQKLEISLYHLASELGLGETFPSEQGPWIDDDHLPITKAGLKTIDLIDFDYAPYWHTLNDTVDKCSPDSLGKVGKLLQAWLMLRPPFHD
jgi:hypothetical protein